jgi:integrase
MQKLSEIGGHWLSKRRGSDNWCITSFDAATRQTKRVSTGTDDFQQAEIALAKHVTSNAVIKDQPAADVPLATLLVRYWDNHASKIASRSTSKVAIALWVEFWQTATVSELSVVRQEEFIAWLKGRGYKNSYVSRVLVVGRAAVTRAFKRQEITSAPFIMDEKDRSDEAEAYRLTKPQMIRLIKAARDVPQVFTFIMIAMNTLARPSAVLELRPDQVDLDARLIDLNPQGRKRTKKGRPVLPITKTLMPFVLDTECKRFILWKDEPVKAVRKSFNAAVKKAGLPPVVTPYTIRHTMATEMRARGVPAWEVKGWLGHSLPGATEKYAKFAPDYMSAGAQAIEAYVAEISKAFD